MALTLRLSEEETRKLSAIQDYFSVKTASKAIVMLIESHEYIIDHRDHAIRSKEFWHEEYVKLRHAIEAKENAKAEIDLLMQNRLSSMEALNS